MRSCILIAVACILIPAATLASDTWQRTPGNVSLVVASQAQQKTGPGHHVVGPSAALLRLPGPGNHVVGPTAALLRLIGPGYHVIGPTAALLGLFGDVRYHLLGPKAAPCRRPSTRVVIQESAE